jgi:hypothetical protein
MGSAVAIGAAVAGGALEAYGSVQAGQESARSTMFEQAQFAYSEEEKQHLLKIQERQYKTRAAQAETARREELTASLETLMAIRAGRGVGSTTPTASAITESLISDEVSAARTERLGYLTQADEARRARQISKTQVRLSAANARAKAKSSLLAGYIGAGTAIAGSVYKVAKAGK